MQDIIFDLAFKRVEKVLKRVGKLVKRAEKAFILV